MRKYDMISGLAEYTAHDVVRNEDNWKRYLNTASRLYKYPFKDQLLIYAQRPDATACASIEIWNEKMHCWVNRGAKGIALIDDAGYNRSGLKYVFDISDVHKARRIGRFPHLWEIQEAHEESVLDKLESIYGDTGKGAGFIERIREIAGRIAEDCYLELASDMEYLKEGSFLEELDELNVAVRLRETLADSISYTVLRRCGVPESVLSEEISFPYIHEFNTVETLSQLGSNVSDLSKPILMEIGKTIKTYEKEVDKNLSEKGLENTLQKHYNPLKRESEERVIKETDFEIGMDFNTHSWFIYDNVTDANICYCGTEQEAKDHVKWMVENNRLYDREKEGILDESEIREEWGLSDPDVTDGQAPTGDADEVRNDAEEILTGEQERNLHGTSAERETDRASAFDPETGRGENGTSDRTDEADAGSDRADESGKSDALGADDGGHQTLSGGSRSDGIDLQLNIPEPGNGYQQLSLFPSFEEQVGNIAAAEASIQYTMPAAFSLPQEQIDTVLRSGGGRDNSRKRIYAKYQQGKSPEEMAEFLKNEYKTTGKGFEFDGNPVSLWFDETGMRIGYGTSAKENPLALMSWSEVESNIRSMVENGTYMGANEIFLVDAVERGRIANDINYFFRDGISETPESLELKVYNFPESIERLCELLSTQEGRALLTEELTKAKAQLDSGEKQIKWRYVKRPEYLLEQLSDLSVAKKEYPALDTVEVKQEDFITQDEIDYRLTGGSGFEHGKFRIYEYFMEGHSRKENVAFLKNEYGTGGSSHALPGSDSGHEDHDAKGIRLEKGDYGSPYAKVLLNWNVVEKRISELVKADKYLSPEGKEAYAQYKQGQAEKAMQREQAKLEHGVRLECKDAIEKAIAENFDVYTLPRDTAKGVIEQFGKERVEFVLANVVMNSPNDGRYSVNNREWAQSIVPHATWDDREFVVSSHPAVVDGFINQVRRYMERDREPERNATDKVLEMAALVPICGTLGLKDVVEWNEETDAVRLNNGERTLEGKEAFDMLFTLATDYVLNKTLDGDMEKALQMDGFLKEAGKFAERYDIPAEEQTEEQAVTDTKETITEAEEVTARVPEEMETEEPTEDVTEEAVSDTEVMEEPEGTEEQADAFSDIDAQVVDVEKISAKSEEPTIDKSGAVNYHITPGEETAGKGFAPKEKFRQNVEAIRTLEKIESEHRIATPEEQEILAKYVGWGGLAYAFDDTKANWVSEYKELKELLSPEEYSSARESTLNAHYTSPVIIKSIYDAIDRMGFSKGNILEIIIPKWIQGIGKIKKCAFAV